MIQSKNKRGMGEDILTPIVVHITNGSLSDSYYSSYQDNLDSILNSARNLIMVDHLDVVLSYLISNMENLMTTRKR